MADNASRLFSCYPLRHPSLEIGRQLRDKRKKSPMLHPCLPCCLLLCRVGDLPSCSGPHSAVRDRDAKEKSLLEFDLLRHSLEMPSKQNIKRPVRSAKSSSPSCVSRSAVGLLAPAPSLLAGLRRLRWRVLGRGRARRPGKRPHSGGSSGSSSAHASFET